MSYHRLGCCGSCSRMMLLCINVLFFVMCFVVFILAAVLRWSSYLSKYANTKDIDSLVQLGGVSNVSTVVLVVSGFGTFLSLIGLFGANSVNKCLLITYEVLIVIIFLIQAIAVLVLIFTSAKLEDNYRGGLLKLVNDINAKGPSSANSSCSISKALSNTFNCCGYNSSRDFKFNYNTFCCSKGTTIGCNAKVIDDIEHNAITLVFIPNLVLLLIELFAIMTVPCLAGKSGRRGEFDASNPVYDDY